MSAFLLLCILGGILAVDERAGWQSLLAQPVFAAAVVGVIVGEMSAALAVGVVLELVWLSILPMRGLRRPDGIVGAIVGAGTAALLLRLTGDPRFIFVVSVGTVLGLVVGEVAPLVTKPAHALQRRYLERFSAGDGITPRMLTKRLAWLHAGSVVYIFVVETVVLLIFLPLCFTLAERFTRYVDGTIVDGAAFWLVLVPAFGAASLIHLYWHHHMKRVLILSAVLAFLVLWLN